MIYEVCDNGSPITCDTAIVVINVTPVNDGPIAVKDITTTSEDTPVTIDVTANDTDPDGTINVKSVKVTKKPSKGTVTIDPVTGKITYVPTKNTNGEGRSLGQY